MSAHVLEEEREKCEEIGMNGFITKPFKEDNIKNILALTLQNKLNNPIKSKWENLELPNLVELADGDEEFISNLFSIYLKNTAIELEKIKQAHKDNDISVIKKSAHKLKPSFITFQLMKLHAIAENLEDSNTMNEQISFFISLLSQSLIDIKKKEKTFNS